LLARKSRGSAQLTRPTRLRCCTLQQTWAVDGRDGVNSGGGWWRKTTAKPAQTNPRESCTQRPDRCRKRTPARGFPASRRFASVHESAVTCRIFACQNLARSAYDVAFRCFRANFGALPGPPEFALRNDGGGDSNLSCRTTQTTAAAGPESWRSK
jgi:hypothetical protein